MKKKLLWLNLLLFFSIVANAQELKVKSFERLDRDLMARTNERRDLNDEPCAIVRMSVANAKDFTFEGNVIGDVIYRPGEAIVYMTARSRNVTIKSDKFGILKYDFPERLEKQVVYKLSMNLELSEDQKKRTLVMPVFGLNKAFSYGVMVGVVKKYGPYLKAKYDFKNNSTDLECTNDGFDSTGNEIWFTGQKKNTRMSVTAGAMMRVALPLYVFAGTGYGYRTLAWETIDGKWAKNEKYSYNGLEFETGLVYRYTNYAVSAGIQTNQFKYWEFNLGIGIMF